MTRVGTSRVQLRSVTSRDRDAYLAATRASRRLHRPWVNPPTTKEGFAAMVQRGRDDSFEPMIVSRLQDGAIAGFFHVSHIIRGDLQSAFLGFGAVRGLKGRGT